MARQQQNTAEEIEDHGVLDAPVVDTTAIGVLGARTAQVSVDLPRGYEDLDDDIVDDDVIEGAPAPLSGGSIMLEMRDGQDETDEHRSNGGPDVEDRAADHDDVVDVEEAVAHGETGGIAEAPTVDASVEPTAEEPAPAPAADAPERSAGPEPRAEPHAPLVRAREQDPVEGTPMSESETPATQRFITQPVASKRVSGTGPERVEQLTSDRLVERGRRTKARPEGPWRGVVHRISGGLINMGESRRTRAHRAMSARIAAPLPGRARFVPVLSRKGGVGKTTVTTLLGMALADARDDRIVAVDANPDRGTLSDRIEARTARTVRDLVRGHENIHGYADISDLVARDETRLDVIASETDPQVAEAFDDSDYRTVAGVAAHYYSIVLTDTGTGIVHSVMDATLDLADELVVVAGASIDEARLASETLTWLEAHGHGALVKNAVVVLNQSAPGRPLVRLDEIEAHFSSRVRAVVRLPYDGAIATGGAITFRDLRPETRRAAREAAAHVVEGMRTAALHAVGAVA